MLNKDSLSEIVKEIERKFQRQMPKVRKEVTVYEEKLANGTLTKNPRIAPQFNGR